jgi:hypothetical protein
MIDDDCSIGWTATGADQVRPPSLDRRVEIALRAKST